MTFTPKAWQDTPSTGTPLSAAALIDLETRVTDYANTPIGPTQVSAAASGWSGYTALAADDEIHVDATGPAAPTATAVSTTSGGSLPQLGIGWVITATVGGVESVASKEVAVELQFNGSQKAVLTWTNPTGTTQNKIYRSTTTNNGYYTGNRLVATQSGSAGAGTYTDTGTTLTAGNPPTGTLPVTLPTSSIATGKPYRIVATGNTRNQVVVQPASGSLVLPGGATATTFTLGTRWSGATAQSVLAVWDSAWVLTAAANNQNASPTNPIEINNLAIASAPISGQNPTYTIGGRYMTIEGGYAYIASPGSILQIVDLSSPGNEQCVGGIRDTTNLPGASGLRKSGDYLYIAQANDPTSALTVFNVSSKLLPVLAAHIVDSHLSSSTPIDVEIAGHYCYVANTGASSIVVFDIANPTNPVFVTTITTPSALGTLAVRGNILWALGTHLTAIDITNPASPTVLGSGPSDSTSSALAVSSRYAYVAVHNGAFNVYDISDPTTPTIVGSVTDLTRIPAALGVSCAGRYVYVCNQNEINGIAIIDVINPTAPAIVGNFTWGTPGEHVVCCSVNGRYLYCGAGDGGTFHVLDLGSSQQFSTLTADAFSTSAAWVNDNLDVGGTLRAGRIISPDIPIPYVASGNATLVAGTVSVANTAITANSIVKLWNISGAGTVGALSVTLTAGTGFAIHSTSSSDTSKIRWEIVAY